MPENGGRKLFELTANRYEVPFWIDRNVLELVVSFVYLGDMLTIALYTLKKCRRL